LVSTRPTSRFYPPHRAHGVGTRVSTLDGEVTFVPSIRSKEKLTADDAMETVFALVLHMTAAKVILDLLSRKLDGLCIVQR
jgi:hypothetical protein